VRGIEARPTLYKGIQMRSRLEADYAASLDRSDQPWEYEPTCFASDSGQWLPDFRIPLRYPTYIELKPTYLLERQDGEEPNAVIRRIDAILAQMEVAFSSEPGASLELVFWSYGADTPNATITRDAAFPWMILTGFLSFPMIWTGRGQLLRLVTEPS
jgi:hypothetical protein